MLIIGCDSKSERSSGMDRLVALEERSHALHGNVDAEGRISGRRKYAVPEHPDWGWRTEITPSEHGFVTRFQCRASGEEDLGVETAFTRA